MEIVQQAITAIGVILLAGAAAWWLRGRGVAAGNRRTRHLEMLERLALTPQHSLMLVRIRDRVVVLGVSPSGCSLVQTLEGRQASCGE